MVKKFKEIRNRMSADRQARVTARTEELLATLPLFEIRQARRLSQVELAEKLQVNQADFPEGRYQIDSFDEIASDLKAKTRVETH